MQTLREEMKRRGYLSMQMKASELQPDMRPKGISLDTLRNARLFTKDGNAEVGAEEARSVRETLKEFVRRQEAKSKNASFHAHPRRDSAHPRTWIVLTE